MPDSTLIVRQVWMAASLKPGCRPRWPVGVPTQVMAGSIQIVSEPRHFGAMMSAGRFRVLRIAGAGLPMPPSYHAGFTR